MVDPSSFSLDVALANLAAAFTNLRSLIVALSYVMGVYFFVRGVMMYRVFAVQTLSSAHKGEIAGPLVYICVGIFLIYFPSTLHSSLTTVFGTTQITGITDMLGYHKTSGMERWQAISDVVVKYTYLVGLIAFVRGWVILSRMGNSGSQPGSMGKGIIHLVGGVLLINIVKTFNILASTLGYTG